MKNLNKKSIILGMVCGILLGATTVGYAANEYVQAILNKKIQVSLDGVIQEFRDESTNEIQYPITYNDRTYLPLRTVANLVDVSVGYDEQNNIATLVTGKTIKTNYKSYSDVLDAYIAFAQSGESYGMARKSYIYNTTANEMKYLLENENICYAYKDLNLDGADELIIYNKGGMTAKDGSLQDVICGVYAMKNNGVYAVIVGGERDCYYLRKNNIIENIGSSGASDSVHKLYAVSKELELVEVAGYHWNDNVNEDILEGIAQSYDDMCLNIPYETFVAATRLNLSR